MKKECIIAILLSVLLPAVLYAQSNKFTIEGKIKTDSVLHGMIYLIGKNVKPDSVALVNNRYHFTGTLERPGSAVYISWRDRPLAQQLRETKSILETGSSLLILEAGNIEVEHELDFKHIKVTGSKLHQDYDFISREIVVGKKNADTVLSAYILQHPDSWFSFMNLQQKVRAFGPELSQKLYQNLSNNLKQYSEVTDLGKQITAMQTSSMGKTAPEFTLNTPDGHPVSLSSYRGKYVLLDFWASWCAPCRAESPTVKGVYNLYKDSGFDVLSVSLDLATSKAQWVAAIKQDGLTWTQVSDLKGFDSDVAVNYGVHAIPDNFLIDPSGKIIARNLRGYDLEQKMKQIFKKAGQ